MNLVITIIRILIALLVPLLTVVLSILTLRKTRMDHGTAPEAGQACLRCGQSRMGSEGLFHYTESVGNARERAAKQQLRMEDTPILGSESHFICDQCARRYIRSEIFQILLMVLPYPLYRFVILPIFAQNGIFAGFLIETMLVVFTLAGATAAFDLHRAARMGDSPLTEARDWVAVNQRKKALGKRFSYYTRMGTTHLRK